MKCRFRPPWRVTFELVGNIDGKRFHTSELVLYAPNYGHATANRINSNYYCEFSSS